MTVVRLPVRVRLEIAADRLDDPAAAAHVTELAWRATSRAVQRARSMQVAALASVPDDGVEPRVDVRFTGDQLPGRLRDDIEGPLRAQALVATAQLVAGRGGATPQRARDGGEPLDEARLVADPRRRDADAYLVPHYDRHGDLAPVQARGRRAEPSAQPRTALRLRHFASADELWAAVLVWFRGAPPRRVVVITANAHGWPVAAILELTTGGAVAEIRELGPVVEFLPADASGRARAAGYAPPGRADRLRFMYRADSEQAREDVRTRLIADDLRADPRRPPRVSEEMLQRLARQRARDIPSPPGRSQYFELLSNGVRVHVFETLATTLLPEEDLPVVVLTETVTLGEDGPKGYGVGCPPLDAGSVPEWLASFGLLNPTLRPRTDAFLAEPPLEFWPPELYAELSALVTDVAGRLHMTPGRFVGAFLIAAMTHVDKRCRGLGDFVAADRKAQLQAMGSAFGPVARLADLYTHALAAFDAAEALPCPLQRQIPSWLLHFFEAFGPARDDAVASMFVAACQDVLLEVLVSSNRELHRRAANFPAYMKVTRLFLVIVLSETAALSDLREKLIAREQEDALRAAPTAGGLPMGAWLSASEALLDLAGVRAQAPTTPGAGDVRVRGARYEVLDGKGRWWTRAELDAVISTGRKEVFAVDPLLEKVSDLPELVHRLQDAQRRDTEASAGGEAITKAVDAEFARLLDGLLAENSKRTQHVQRDRTIAFGLATFQEAAITTAADIGAKLYGIHKLADDRLRPMVTDEQAYVLGMRRLAAEEIGKAELEEFFNLFGVAVLAVFCPPAAFLVGAVQAVDALEDAFEHRGIQRAMLGGDDIISQAQAEAEMWGAVIGAALTFLPEVPGAVRGLAGGTKALVKGEGREFAVNAARQAMRRATAHLAEVTAEHFAKAFVREVATAYVMNLALSAAISRVTAAVARQVEVTGSASVLDLPDILGQAISGPTSSEDAP